MRVSSTLAAVAVLLGGLTAGPAYAQRGMGQTTGIARQGVRPDVESFRGKVRSVDTGPCEKTTGRASIGVHFLLQTKEATLNIHLGPAIAVDHIADQLSIGKKVTVDAFRTEIMPENHYVAQVLTFGDTSIRLRDANLRPVWAGNAAMPRAGDRPPSGPGKARGRGYGWGRGGGSPMGGPGRGGYGHQNRGGYGRGQGQRMGRPGAGTWQGYGRGR